MNKDNVFTPPGDGKSINGGKKKKLAAYDKIRALAVALTADAFECERAYVRLAINGTRTGGRTPEILKFYRAKYEELKKATQTPKTIG